MATKFKVWVDSPSAGTNVQSMSDFSSDSQRQNGFAAGNAASAIRVNTALREATLITTAIMDTIAPNSNVDVTSTVAQVKSAIANAFSNNKCINTITWNNSTFVLTFLFTDGTSTTVDMSGIKNSTTMYGATRDGSGNVITSTYLTQTNAANTYLTQTNAASTYLTQVNAASTYETISNASQEYIRLDGRIDAITTTPLYLHRNVVLHITSSTSDTRYISFICPRNDDGLITSTNITVPISEFWSWYPTETRMSTVYAAEIINQEFNPVQFYRTNTEFGIWYPNLTGGSTSYSKIQLTNSSTIEYINTTSNVTTVAPYSILL